MSSRTETYAKVVKYRDMTGIDAVTFERVLQGCDRTTLSGKRDYALLRLLWGNALRLTSDKQVERHSRQGFELIYLKKDMCVRCLRTSA